MASIETIKAPIREEILQFERFFRKTLENKVPLLNTITNYLLRRKGKQMRPMFVFLTAGLYGKINQSTHVAASLIELLHTATLIHDDVVDNSYERRGFFSIHAIWKSKISVLVGDYFLAKGLLLSVNHKEYDLLEIVTEAVREMSEGEIMQIQKSRKLDITEEEYFDIIRKKTATLIAACTACGCKSAGNGLEEVEKMKTFGENVGMAFQIRDDLFDFQPHGVTGKPRGNDIQERKMTLPLIRALSECGNIERKNILHIIRQNNLRSSEINKVMEFVVAHGGLEYSYAKMNEYRKSAQDVLRSFPATPVRQSLTDLVIYTTEREK